MAMNMFHALQLNTQDPTSNCLEILYSRLRVLETANAQSSTSRKRTMVALAGVPGCGKSTLSAALAELYEERTTKPLRIVAMDGFHYTKAQLRTFADPEEAILRRGAPFTFNSGHFVRLIKRLRYLPINLDHSGIPIPSFDHSQQDPIEESYLINPEDETIILEGNYVLLGERPWEDVAAFVDEKWFINVPDETAIKRLVARHIVAGIETNPEDARRRVLYNDIENARYIRESLIEPNVIIHN